MSRHTEAAIFDLDGVLLDSEPVFCRGLQAPLQPDELTDLEYRTIVRISAADTVRWVIERFPRDESPEELQSLMRELPPQTTAVERDEAERTSAFQLNGEIQPELAPAATRVPCVD